MQKGKESWIETLIELLNEYDEIREYAEVDLEDELISLKIISKWYWFIQRLVDNDKIDIVKVYKNLTDYEIELRIRAVKELVADSEEKTVLYLNLLMLLSIQESPIDFLISILK